MSALLISVALLLADMPTLVGNRQATTTGIGGQVPSTTVLIFDPIPNTGLYLREDGTIGLVCDGVERQTVTIESVITAIRLGGSSARIYCDGVDRVSVDLVAIVNLWLLGRVDIEGSRR